MYFLYIKDERLGIFEGKIIYLYWYVLASEKSFFVLY
jgi:hypothetical protein